MRHRRCCAGWMSADRDSGAARRGDCSEDCARRGPYGGHMRRREFIALLGGAVTAAHAPLARRSQQSRWSATWQPRPGSQCCRTQRNLSVAWSRWGLARAATLTIDYRWAEGHFDRLPALAAELARDQVAVIFANGGAPVARAAMAATASIPIVFSIGDDPVGVGLVDNINRPTGNVT